MRNEAIFHWPAFVERTSELDADDAAEVLKAFLADTAGKMTSVASGHLSRSAIKREAHSIKSSSAALGFAELSSLASQLEARAETMSPELLDEAIGVLRRILGETATFARSELLIANIGIP